MTPEAVIFRYLEAAHRQPLSVEDFVRVLGADADLLGRWLNLASCPAEPDALKGAIADLRQDEIVSLAQAQAWAVLPVAGSARLGLDQWQSVLRSAFLAEILAEQLGMENAETVRWRVLLATSGVSLSHDPALMELAAFRGVRPELLQDASLLIRIFGVVDAFEVLDEYEAAQLARSLLDIDAGHFPELVEWAAGRCAELVRTLELAAEPEADWSNRLWVQQQVAMLTALLGMAEDEAALQTAHAFITRSLFHQVPLLLLEVKPGLYQSAMAADVDIHLNSSASLVAETLRSGQARMVSDRADLSVGDRQLLRRMDCDEAQCLPVRFEEQSVGALLMTADDDVDYEFALDLYVQGSRPEPRCSWRGG